MRWRCMESEETAKNKNIEYNFIFYINTTNTTLKVCCCGKNMVSVMCFNDK